MKKISLYAAYFASRQLQAWMLHEISVVSTWFEVATSVHRAAQQFIDWNHYILQYLAELPVKHNQMLSAIRFAMQNVMRNLVSSQWTWAINATLEHRAIAMPPYLPGRSTAIYSNTSAKPQPWKRYRCLYDTIRLKSVPLNFSEVGMPSLVNMHQSLDAWGPVCTAFPRQCKR